MAYYHEPVRLLDPPTRQSASFNTTFGMAMVKGTLNGTSTVGDGMAFVISADNSTIGNFGMDFGIFNDRGFTTFRSIVVEFDTYYNSKSYDISDDHVSIDHLITFAYRAAANTSDAGVDLRDEGTVYAWVEYSHETQQLKARISNTNSRPVDPLVQYEANLSDFLEEYMWVGFSSGSGKVYSNYYMGDWTFGDWTFESYGIQT